MKSVTKKSKGNIEVITRHRTQKGFIFRPTQVVEYYSIVNIKQECGCSSPVTYSEFYETKYGLLPISKGKKA